MPYIKQEDRARAAKLPETPGELNYAITQLCIDYANQEPPSYAMYNLIIGVLECAKLEFYRRVVVPYENGKHEQNGDVY